MHWCLEDTPASTCLPTHCPTLLPKAPPMPVPSPHHTAPSVTSPTMAELCPTHQLETMLVGGHWNHSMKIMAGETPFNNYKEWQEDTKVIEPKKPTTPEHTSNQSPTSLQQPPSHCLRTCCQPTSTQKIPAHPSMCCQHCQTCSSTPTSTPTTTATTEKVKMTSETGTTTTITTTGLSPYLPSCAAATDATMATYQNSLCAKNRHSQKLPG